MERILNERDYFQFWDNMRSIDDSWDAGDYIYLDDVDKCDDECIIEANGEKHYLHLSKKRRKNAWLGMYYHPQEILKFFQNGRIKITKNNFSIISNLKDGKYTKDPIAFNNPEAVVLFWVDELGERTIKNGLYEISLNKANKTIQVMFAIKHRTKTLTMTIGSDNKKFFRGRGKYLKKFVSCDIKDYTYYENFIPLYLKHHE